MWMMAESWSGTELPDPGNNGVGHTHTRWKRDERMFPFPSPLVSFLFFLLFSSFLFLFYFIFGLYVCIPLHSRRHQQQSASGFGSWWRDQTSPRHHDVTWWFESYGPSLSSHCLFRLSGSFSSCCIVWQHAAFAAACIGIKREEIGGWTKGAEE